jgi:hypothetical protein
MRWQGKWIYIDYLCPSKSGKTKIYQVMDEVGNHLGDIKWYAPWRKYAFFPEIDTLYEQDCLRDIAKFLEEIKQ